MLGVVEIDSDKRIAAIVMFDLDDFDAAIAELDARYLAGEAAAHARTWSVIAGAYRRAQPARTPRDDAGLGQHRPPARDSVRARRDDRIPPRGWTSHRTSSIYIEVVHRLSNLGAVITYAAHGTSQEGFDAEWRGIGVLTIDGDLINRFELFDEADLDAALARFDQLSRPAPRLENAASRVASASWRTSRPATGTPWRRYWPTTFSATIAVGS